MARSEQDNLYLELRRRLVESGEWDRLSTELAEKLNESGWLDQLRDRAKEIANNSPSQKPSVQEILDKIKAQAIATLPHDMKAESLRNIQSSAEKEVL